MKNKICPRCGSKNIEIIREGKIPGKPYLYYGAQNWYKCMKCGFESPIFPEKKIRKKTLYKIPHK